MPDSLAQWPQCRPVMPDAITVGVSEMEPVDPVEFNFDRMRSQH